MTSSMTKGMSSEIKPLVLIVDDEKSNLFILKKTISNYDCIIETASSGSEAAKKCEEKKYAIILLDMKMPGLDGHGTLIKIKESPLNEDAAIFMITGVEPEKKFVERSYKLGVVDFLTKPITTQVLRKKVGYFLEQYQNKMLLKKEKDVSERLLKSKMNLMASITHELRSPLFAMVGMADILETMGLNKEQESILHKIQSNAEYLISVVNSFLDFSKLEEGKSESKIEEFNLYSEISELVDIMSYQNQRKSDVDLRVEIDQDVNTQVYLDKTKLRHILINLISNSLKFTLKGKVTVKVSKQENEYLLFEVIDTGIGIKNEDVNSLFEKYVQVEDTSSQNVGTGLGLSISKVMVSEMGGELKVNSTYGEGSTFYFEIPLGSIDQNIKDIDQEILNISSYSKAFDDRKLKLLVIDDVEDNLFIISTYLSELNIEIETCDDPFRGLALLKSEQYDLCLLDINMPNMSGFQVLKDYLKAKSAKKKTTIIALTAHVIDEIAQEKYQKAGFYKVLSKPLRRKELVLEMVEWIDHHEDLNIKKIDKDIDDVDILNIFEELDKNIKNYLPKYLANKVEELKELSLAVENNDVDTIRSIVHKVLGTALSFGIQKLNDDLVLVQQYVSNKMFEKKKMEISTLVNESLDYIIQLSEELEKSSKE